MPLSLPPRLRPRLTPDPPPSVRPRPTLRAPDQPPRVRSRPCRPQTRLLASGLAPARPQTRLRASGPAPPSGPRRLFYSSAALVTAVRSAELDFRAFVARRSCGPSLRSHAAHALPSVRGAAPAGPSLPHGRACPGAETPHPEAPRAEEASPSCCLCRPRVDVAPELSVPAARPSEKHSLLKSPPLPLLGPSSV